MQNVDRSFWTKHVHKGVTHHSGWLPLLQRMHILTKAGNRMRRDRAYQPPMLHRRFGRYLSPLTTARTAYATSGGGMAWYRGALALHADSKYRLAPFKNHIHTPVFATMAKIHNILIGSPVPRSLDEWVSVCKRAGAAVVALYSHAALTDGATYGFMWLLRSFLLAEVRGQEIAQLSVSATNTVADLSAGFPDQCSWMSLVPRNTLVRKFMKDIKYHEPVELLTCKMCVLGSTQARNWSVAELTDARIKISKARKELRLSPDEPAHPIEVLCHALRPR